MTDRQNTPRVLRGLGAVALAVTALALAPSAAQAQAWPTKPVRVIVPFSAGSGTDILARLTSEGLTKALGQTFVVENKQGADGIIGSDQVAKAVPDGYLIGVMPSSTIVMNPALYKLPFDPIKDFVPIYNMASLAMVVGVQPTLPIRNVAELITYAKANPGKLNYAAGSTFTHLGGEMFKLLAGVSMQAIPYKGTAPQVTAMLGNEVEVIFDPFLGLQHIKSGRIRPLAVTGTRRSSVLPDVPTLQEAGLKDYAVETWIGMFAPAGTPRRIVDVLHAETGKIFATAPLRERLAGLSYDANNETPEQFGKRILADTARWAKTVKDSNFKVDK